MGKLKQYYENKAELALMGKFMPVETEDEVKFITNYILTVLNKEDLKQLDIYADCLHRYNNTNKVTHIGTNKVLGMPCIVYCIDTQDGETPKPFEEDYGTGFPVHSHTCLIWQTMKCVPSLAIVSLRNVLTGIITE